MNKAVQYFLDQIAFIRSGGDASAAVATIRVPYHGQNTPIFHIASVARQGNRTQITPYDSTLVGQIAATLKQAGFNAYVFSKTQVVVSSSLYSGQDRERVRTQVCKLAEEARVAVRNVRKKARQALQKEALPKVEEQKRDRQLQEWTDASILEIDRAVDAKMETI